MGTSSKWGKVGGGIFQAVFGFYMFFVVVIAAPYFNWRYARENGFAAWLTLGLIVPTAKAFVWPVTFFAAEKPRASKASMEHFAMSMTYWQAAAKIVRDVVETRSVTPTEAVTMLGLFEKALAEAKQVDVSELNLDYPSLGDTYRDRFVAGLQTVVDSLHAKDQAQTDRGFVMLNGWADWLELHREKLQR